MEKRKGEKIIIFVRPGPDSWTGPDSRTGVPGNLSAARLAILPSICFTFTFTWNGIDPDLRMTQMKAGVIYLIGITKQVEEIIFPEAQGVTPDIDTKQAKRICFQNRLSRYGIKYIHTTPQGREEKKTNQEICDTKAYYERRFFEARLPQ